MSAREKMSLSVFLLSSILFLLIGVVEAYAVEGLAEALGTGSGILLVLFANEHFMTVLIIVLIYALMYNIVILGVSLMPNQQQDDSWSRKISYVLAGLFTIALLFGAGSGPDGFAVGNVQQRVNEIMGFVGTFGSSSVALFVAAIVYAVGIRKDMEKGEANYFSRKRLGFALLMAGLVVWAGHGMMGDSFAISGFLFAISGGIMLFLDAVGMKEKGESSGVLSNIGNALADRIRNPKQKDVASGKMDDVEKDYKKNKLDTKISHDPEFFKTKIMDIKTYVDKEKDILKEEIEHKGSIAEEIKKMAGVINSRITNQLAAKDIAKTASELSDELKKNVEKEENHDEKREKRNRRYDRRIYRDISKMKSKLTKDYETSKKKLEQMESDQRLQGLSNYDEILRNARSTIENQKLELDTLVGGPSSPVQGGMTGLLTQLEELHRKVRNADKKLSNTIEEVHKELKNIESEGLQTSKKLAVIGNEANYTLYESTSKTYYSGLFQKKNELVNKMKEIYDECSTESGLLAKVQQSIEYIEKFLAQLMQINNIYESSSNTAEQAFNRANEEVDKKVEMMDKVKGMVKEAEEEVNNYLTEYDKMTDAFFSTSDDNVFHNHYYTLSSGLRNYTTKLNNLQSSVRGGQRPEDVIRDTGVQQEVGQMTEIIDKIQESSKKVKELYDSFYQIPGVVEHIRQKIRSEELNSGDKNLLAEAISRTQQLIGYAIFDNNLSKKLNDFLNESNELYKDVERRLGAPDAPQAASF